MKAEYLQEKINFQKTMNHIRVKEDPSTFDLLHFSGGAQKFRIKDCSLSQICYGWEKAADTAESVCGEKWYMGEAVPCLPPPTRCQSCLGLQWEYGW